MGEVIPTRLRLEGFLGYTDQTLDLKNVHVAAITGPVGAGKTSIIEAMSFAIWGEHRAETLDELIHDGCDRTRVSLVFDDGTTITRERARGRNGTLSLSRGDDTLTGHTSDDTQRTIDGLVGMSYDEALAGPLMVQSAAGSFMDLSPKDRKALLFRWVVDAGHWVARELQAREVMRDAASRITSNTGAMGAMGDPVDVIALQTELLRIEDDLTKGKADLLRAREAADKARRARDNFEATIKRAEAADRELEAAREDFRVAKADYDRIAARSVALAGEIVAHDAVKPEDPPVDAEHDDLVDVLLQARGAVLEATARKAHADAELAAVRAIEVVECPHCGGKFQPGLMQSPVALAGIAEAAAKDLGRFRSIQDRAEQAVRVSESARAARLRWQQARDRLAAEAMGIEEAVTSARARLETASQRGKVALAEQRRYDGLSEVDDFGDALKAAEREVSRIDTIVTERVYAKSRLEAMVLRATQDNEKIEAYRAAIVADEEVVRTHKVLVEAFGRDGIPTKLLEAALPRLEVAANEVLARMPGGLSILIATLKDTAKGTTRERLDVIVQTEDGTRRGYRMLSGGQRFRVDMALRMALTSLRDYPLGMMVIDEGLDRFQDPEGREAMMDALTAVAQDFGRVLVISHNPDVYTRLPSRITVTMENGVSRAEVS